MYTVCLKIQIAVLKFVSFLFKFTAFGYHLVINLQALSVKLYSLKNPKYTPKYEKRKVRRD